MHLSVLSPAATILKILSRQVFSPSMSRKVNKQAGLAVHLPLALRTGKYLIGYKQAITNLIHKRVQCLVVANNLPMHMRARLEYYCQLADKTPIKYYEGSNNELAVLSGLKFRASVLAILDAGEAEALSRQGAAEDA